jgi:anthranilate synthase/aminodeoxychorismate synthase-like glutamine amidotransferase
MKIAFVDHYDSFSGNLLDWLHGGGIQPHEITRVYFDDAHSMNLLKSFRGGVVLGPGPNSPDQARQSLQLAESLMNQCPLFGVCLGHQILGVIGGGQVRKGADPWHGHVRSIEVLERKNIFTSFDRVSSQVFYNSLVLDEATLTKDWIIEARDEFGEIAAMRHATAVQPVWSVQFHPESFLAERGSMILHNWLNRAKLL